MTESLDVLRAELQARGVDDLDMSNEPFGQFHRWFRVCVDAGVHEPEAMIVSSVDDAGRPSSRHVLLRGVDRGFVFFTNFTSQKGRELTAQPVAAICFPWNVLARQVRVAGVVEMVAEEEADDYFGSRPREPDRRLGLAPERGDPGPLDARASGGRDRRPFRRAGGAPSASLGRLQGDPPGGRVLAGPAVAPARPVPVLPSPRRIVAQGTSQSLIGQGFTAGGP